MKTCEICGKSVKKASRRFCSPACSNASKSGDPNHVPITGMVSKTCEICGKSFDVWGYRSDKAKVCSNRCRHLLQTKNSALSLICAWCGKHFTRRKSRQKFNQRRATENGHIKTSLPYCSKSCQGNGLRELYSPEERSAFEHGRSGINSVVYAGSAWREIQRRIYKRDHHACRLCGSSYRLSVHHIDHDNKNGNDANLISLCGVCHAKERWFRFVYEPILRKLVKDIST